MNFYTFRQNNSGGSFIGPVEIIIEADSAEEANDRASSYGIYFDGCNNGRDCSCCGDRWYRAYGDGDPVPSRYGVPLVGTAEEIVRANPEMFERGWYDEEVIIHYKDGRREIFTFDKQLTELAKKLIRDRSEKLWGFVIYGTGTEFSVSSVKRFYKHDTLGDFWAKDGNTNILGAGFRSKTRYGFTAITFGDTDKATVELFHNRMAAVLPEITQAAKEAASITIDTLLSDQPKRVRDALRKRFN